ncbi:MAG: SAM-dependent methyltransferase [Gammaproteobacteria bacterium]
MKPEQPSYTAEVVACYRAVESLKPEHRRVCYDPLAIHFLRPIFRALCGLGPLVRPLFWLLAERKFLADVAQSIGRTRFIDDYVTQCIGKGIQQLVILGAGYDSRPYRIEGIKEQVKVFEVDYPATQRVKKARIMTLFGSLPSHVTYVAIDFNEDSLEQKLPACGYDTALKTLFIWEGVTYFLSSGAVDDTLAFVREKSGAGSSIIFDYTFRSLIDGGNDSKETHKEKEILARIGEPYTFGVDQGSIRKFLAERGFHEITEADPDRLTALYFKAARQNRRFPTFFPLVYASVKPRQNRNCKRADLVAD